MSKAKFAAVKEMIDEKNYAGARSVLRTIDHPTARTWEEKLNQIAPQHRMREPVFLNPPKPVERQVIYVKRSSDDRSDNRSGRGCAVSALLIIGGIIAWLFFSMGVGYVLIGLGFLIGLIVFII